MKQLLVLAAGIALASSVYAVDETETFRTLMGGTGIFQSTNAFTSKPEYGTAEFLGHNLVSSALGTPLSNIVSDAVLALQIDCASTTASLVAWDNTTSNVLATIAVCANLSVVQQQDAKNTNSFPNREHFVGLFIVTPGNNLFGGSLMIAGRLQLNPTNGCPRAIRMEVDPLDHLFKDMDASNPDNLKDKDILRAGVAHAVGTVNLKFDDGTTNEVLLPFEALSIRHRLN